MVEAGAWFLYFCALANSLFERKPLSISKRTFFSKKKHFVCKNLHLTIVFKI